MFLKLSYKILHKRTVIFCPQFVLSSTRNTRVQNKVTSTLQEYQRLEQKNQTFTYH